MAEVQLLFVNDLLITELTDPDHVNSVVSAILRAGCWTRPIKVERHTNAVMDGHHRLAAAKELRLRSVPCVRLGYEIVHVRPRRSGFNVTPDEILRRALARAPYPPKTTEHMFALPDATCAIDLSELRKGEPTFQARMEWIWRGGQPPKVQNLGARYGRSITEHQIPMPEIVR